MKLPAFLKTCYHYTIGCCCGRRQLETHEEELPLLAVARANQVVLNETALVEQANYVADVVETNGFVEKDKPEDFKSEDTKSEGTKFEEIKSQETKTGEQAKPEDQALPILIPELDPVPSLIVNDSTRTIVDVNFDPSINTDGKLIQERFGVSELVYIAEGSYGFVYKAHDRNDRKANFAIKVVNKKEEPAEEVAGEIPETWYEKTEREVQFLEMVEHENIVKLHDYFWIKQEVESEPCCLVMKTELLAADLDQVLQKVDKPLSLKLTVFIAKQLGAALSHLHQEHKIAHHDVKLQNVMMTSFVSLENKDKLVKNLAKSGFKMIDLGFGRQYSGELKDCKEARHRMGTLMYISYEKLYKTTYNPFLADCFAFGVLLLVIMMGYNEFKRKYDPKHQKIWVLETEKPYNFILEIAQDFFNTNGLKTPMHSLVLKLLAKESKRCHMDQAMEIINKYKV